MTLKCYTQVCNYLFIGEPSENLQAYVSLEGETLAFGYMSLNGSSAFTLTKLGAGEKMPKFENLAQIMRPFRNGKAMVRIHAGMDSTGLTPVGSVSVGEWYLVDRKGKKVEPGPDDHLMKDPLASPELPFREKYDKLDRVNQDSLKENLIFFDDYCEVHYAPGCFAVVDWNQHCICGNDIPGVKPYSYLSTPKEIADAGTTDIQQIAPNVWSVSSTDKQTTVYSEFESPSLFSSGLAPFRTEKGWGYMDWQGHIVIAPRFTWAQPFNRNGYAIAGEKKCTYILHRSVSIAER